MRLREVIFIVGLCLWLAAGVHAADLSGRVVDQATKTPLGGAVVQTEDGQIGTLTDQDGKFTLHNLPEGKVRLVVRSLGYELFKKTVATSAELLEVQLIPVLLHGQDIVVTGDRARRRETPVAFTNVPQREIENTYWAQDIPMLLTQTPGVYAYSDNGNGIGYSYLSVRGFPQSRVSVLINGVPHNDPESHEVYWVDMPDLPASVQDIQIQRGVGSSMYGSSAIGGTINVNTAYANPVKDIRVSTGLGSFGTRKAALNYNSGLINNTYNVYGRFSRLVSDGYRDQSWTDQWAYFLGVARHDGDLVNHFQVYGGQEETHLAYDGIPRDSLRSNRRFNPLTYVGEIDHFDQPHYELLTTWKVNDRVDFDNALYYIKGKGYYDQFRRGRAYEEYNLAPFVDAHDNEVNSTDLVRRRFVDNDFWGVVPRLTYRRSNLRFAMGGEFNSHRGVHTGTVTWAATLPPDSVQHVTPDHRYYDYEVRKLSGSAFLNAEITLANRVTAMGALQYQYRRYRLLHNHYAHNYYLENDSAAVHYATPYGIFSPRVGININVTERVNIFANAAYTRQEPAADEIYDPQDYWSDPGDYFKVFNPKTGEGNNPMMRPEKLLDFELGGAYRARKYSAEVNLYWMRFADEIVYNGGLSDDGVPIRVNAPESIHRGFELSASARPFAERGGRYAKGLELSGNFSLADNYFTDFKEYVVVNWDVSPPGLDTLVRDHNPIAGFPNVLANLQASYAFARFTVAGHLFHAGRIYLDNTNHRDVSVDPYTLLNLSLKVNLPLPQPWPKATIETRTNNVFDVKYETGGYVEDGEPFWMVGAGRNVYVSLALKM